MARMPTVVMKSEVKIIQSVENHHLYPNKLF
jgi:hypothetical protein